MRYYLSDHPHPDGPRWSGVRPVTQAVVLHTAENVADTIGPDGGAEAVAHYGATMARRASWNAVVDKDSIIYMMPDDFEAWHVRGFNDRTIGIEQACQASKWDTYPSDWVDAVIGNAATVVGLWCDKYDIPRRRITRAQFDAGEKGLISHAALDPDRRSDPGAGYPWDLLLEKLGDDSMLTPEQETFLAAFADMSLGLDPAASGTSYPYLLRFYRELGRALGVPGNAPEVMASRLVAESVVDTVARAEAQKSIQTLARVKSVIP